jgi:hypothetical protein
VIPKSESCWTPMFSNENGGMMVCAMGHFVTGVACGVPWFCDHLSLKCTKNPGREAFGAGGWTQWASEENGGYNFLPFSSGHRHHMDGMQCRGHRCDWKRAHCRRIRFS